MFTSHRGDSGIKHKPISNEKQGTRPFKVQNQAQQLELLVQNCLHFMHVMQQLKANIIYNLPARANCLQLKTLPIKNETDAPITIISCRTIIVTYDKNVGLRL
jgi:hypothetical protein